MTSIPLRFPCAGTPLIGMLHPAQGPAEVGVLIMVAGGPQYRIGGHRQLVLWSRKMATAGFPVLRFDFRGMGDSYGDYLGFEDVETDIRAALDRFFASVPTLKQVILWGECNACSASLFFAHKDPRIKGIVMLNPWVRTEAVQAKAIVKHYYLKRLTEQSFWKKVLGLQFDVLSSLRSLLENVRRARNVGAGESARGEQASLDGNAALPDRMLRGLNRFKGELLLILGGRDLVAREFEELINGSPEWRRALAEHRCVRHDLEFADHTFSTAVWRDQVAIWGVTWLEDVRARLGSVPSEKMAAPISETTSAVT